MPITETNRATSARGIGTRGTAVRLMVGGFMVGNVVYGSLTGVFHPASWLLGLLGFPPSRSACRHGGPAVILAG